MGFICAEDELQSHDQDWRGKKVSKKYAFHNSIETR